MHMLYLLFSFEHTATPEIYTLSLHDALPISEFLWSLVHIRSERDRRLRGEPGVQTHNHQRRAHREAADRVRSEEHTSELQSLAYLVCRLLLEKKKKKKREYVYSTLELINTSF